MRTQWKKPGHLYRILLLLVITQSLWGGWGLENKWTVNRTANRILLRFLHSVFPINVEVRCSQCEMIHVEVLCIWKAVGGECDVRPEAPIPSFLVSDSESMWGSDRVKYQKRYRWVSNSRYSTLPSVFSLPWSIKVSCGLTRWEAEPCDLLIKLLRGGLRSVWVNQK